VAPNLRVLHRSGLEFIEPQAGLTAFVKVGDGDRVSEELARRGVGLASGSFFGAPEWVRVFLGARPAAFREGIAKLVAYLSDEPDASSGR
jgi:aspartate/methionine/tyrosine aminotransferase